jgi:molybdopterin molybdotransferase
MIPVDEALARIFAHCAPLPAETVPLAQAAGRALAAPVTAARDQPPFAAAAMDGYAVSGEVGPGATFRVVGQSAAGRAWDGLLQQGEAVRIFTGAPVPPGATRVVIQEDVTRAADTITLSPNPDAATHIRPAGGDFRAGDRLSAPRRLRPVDLALIASMGAGAVRVARRPVVALIATGDELVAPGEVPGPDQIAVSSVLALKALVEAEGAEARILPIARDDAAHLRAVLELARGADAVVTTGGVSVGEHDLVQPVARELGADLALWKVAVRPGKPLMAGRLFGSLFLGLPGNPVSSVVCAHLFLLPALRAMQGLGAWPAPTRSAVLAAPVEANGPRAHYMRAVLEPDGAIRVLPRQDSSLMSVLAQADALLVRPPGDPARPAGHPVRYVPLGS